MVNDISIRLLTPSDLSPQMLQSFNHRQVISQKWVKHGEHYELTKTNEIREWDVDKRVWIPQYLSQQLERGGAVVGAFLTTK